MQSPNPHCSTSPHWSEPSAAHHPFPARIFPPSPAAHIYAACTSHRSLDSCDTLRAMTWRLARVGGRGRGGDGFERARGSVARLLRSGGLRAVSAGASPARARGPFSESERSRGRPAPLGRPARAPKGAGRPRAERRSAARKKGGHRRLGPAAASAPAPRHAAALPRAGRTIPSGGPGPVLRPAGVCWRCCDTE
jgi:hypothetical protein